MSSSFRGTLGGSATNDRQAGFIDTIAEKYPILLFWTNSPANGRAMSA